MGCCDTPDINLTPYHDALKQLLAHVNQQTQTEILVLDNVLDRVLAQDITSTINVPPATNSAMDGYVLNSKDINQNGETRLPISQRICAGEMGEPLIDGSCARIFTGAPIPAQSDTVIMQEWVSIEDNHIVFDRQLKAGTNCRLAGEDIKTGQVILSKGTKIRAQEQGLIASIGLKDIEVFCKTKVGLFLTGDELVEPGQALKPGQIYDSNSYTLKGLLHSMGCDIIHLGIIGDTLDATKQALATAADKADIVITSGGVSVGEEDHVRIALEAIGETTLWRLNIKPGKPLVYGKIDNTAFIGLPGNPVSAFVTFCLFVCPHLKKMQHKKNVLPTSFKVKAQFDWLKPDSRREFLRAQLSQDNLGNAQVDIFKHQGSGVLMSTSWATGIVEVPENIVIKQGDLVNYIPYSEFLS